MLVKATYKIRLLRGDSVSANLKEDVLKAVRDCVIMKRSMYKECTEGRHPLVEVYRADNGYEDEVVRWCPSCGAIVVDVDYDGRVYAGRIMKMRLPKLAKD